MSYTDEQLQMFTYCFTLLDAGFTMSSDMEAELRRKFWWISNTTAYTVVRQWFRNKEKIEEILAQQNHHEQINNEPTSRITCTTSP